MKKHPWILTVLFLIFCNISLQAQKPSMDYFAGKWNLLAKGLPNGDTKLLVNLDKGDTALSGAILDSTGTEISKFSKVELTDTSITVYFTAQGYDVYLVLNKKDQDHVGGSMMGMFDVDGERAKVIK